MTSEHSKSIGYCALHDKNGHRDKLTRMHPNEFMKAYKKSRTDIEIAKLLGVHCMTVYIWRRNLGLPAKGGSL